MPAFDDIRYHDLALRAATILGTTSPKIINAILAQWRCEIGTDDYYPPARNNPGNLTRDASNSIGAKYTIAAGSNPQPGNPIVTFATPEYGADMYATLIKTLDRYAPMRAAVIADDPHAYFDGVISSGYGPTSDRCLEAVYIDPVVGAPLSIGPQPSTADGWVDCIKIARLFHPDLKGILRPVIYPFIFKAWVGVKVTKTWAPGPLSTLRYTADFRKIVSAPHVGYYIRLTDQGATFYL
jgi:hypothetical protein